MDIRSSYQENNYGSILRALVLGHRPKTVVECGVLDGYSLYHIAHAVRFNKKFGVNGSVDAYDLWNNYKYKHGDYDEVYDFLKKRQLGKIVTLYQEDAFDASCYYDNEEVDLLHFDISNDGNILIKMLYIWGNKISRNGVIVFEGGSKERDQVEWMKKYNKIPISDTLVNSSDVNEHWHFQIFTKFPSLTLLWRKF